MKKIVIALIALIIIICIGGLLAYNILIGPVSEDNTEKEIVVPLGTSTTQIAKILKENNLIKNEIAFKIYVKLNKITNFQAGTYYLKENMNLENITEMLKTGIMFDPNEISITFIEGKDIVWLAKTINERTNNKEQDVYDLLENEEYINKMIEKYWFLTDTIKDENIRYPLEGYLFPDTYALADKDATVEEIFEKMLDQMEIVLNSYKNEIEKSEYSVHELLSLASIVELECANQTDRKGVASVFYNRLDRGEPLGSDVSAYYAIEVPIHERAILQAELDRYSPYNTRGPNMEGKLPIGPVCSPSRTSIEAVIRPDDTDYLFFVSDKNLKIYFTTTYAEHEAIIEELQANDMWHEF